MSGANVFIDRSQFPENVRRDLLESLHARAINHKFHYDSYKQAAKWLALHESYSPARNDPSCLRIYDDAFANAIAVLKSTYIHLIGLGCGGGQKEARLLELFRQCNYELTYTPSDASLPLVLAAREAALPFVDASHCHSLVCDLGTIQDLNRAVAEPAPGAARLVTLFGIIPNFEPAPLLSQLTRLLRASDWLLLSANLAPGPNYEAGVRAVLPQYDNALTRDWLMTLLLDVGFECNDGQISFAINTDTRKLCRIEVRFDLLRDRRLCIHQESISFHSGDSLRLFFSYRHTPQTIGALLSEHGFALRGEWLNDSGEEGVFLCRKQA